MTAIVFTGPTLSPEESQKELDAVYLPPVSQGDVYRATQRRPAAIGIIDGYFERVPAVWHKEILWAMSQGVHVFGSASMGALRAAELSAFGMEGVGAIFEAFRDGILEDDDEVAVAHGPAELGYRGQSEAMVNIRSTLAHAAVDAVISARTRTALERIAKELYYPDRSYSFLLQRAAAEAVPDAELKGFDAWLPHGRIDQKRKDAVAMLRLMRERLASGLEPKRAAFAFEHTVYWEHAKIAAGPIHQDERPDSDTISLAGLSDELRLEGTYAYIHQAALGRFLAIEEARRQGMHVSPEMLRETVETFRRERSLFAPADAERWMKDNHLSGDEMAKFVEEEALLQWIQTRTVYDTAAQLLDYLRSTGDYPRVYERADDKQRALESRGLQNPSLEDIGLTERELFHWYFQERLGHPDETDVDRFARAGGFADRHALRRAVLREFCYLERKDGAARTRP
jgi:hypothetical protein